MDRTDSFGEHPGIDWESRRSHFLLNPRLENSAAEQARRIFSQAPDLGVRGHLWVQSSGSSQKADESAKWIALSKEAFLASAQGVNRHLGAERSDRWGVVLPLFHVSGLSILARAYLSGSAVERWIADWNPPAFHQWLQEKKISLLSLVPTQLFDLLQLGLPVPVGLRAVVLGGARLEPAMYERALRRGWPVLPSFGMTELCSQVATAAPGHPDLIPLSHIQFRLDEDGGLCIKSPALFTGFMQERQGRVFWEPSRTDEQGYWKSPDRAAWDGRVLTPLGRDQDFIKIKGEGVNLTELRSRFHAWVLRQAPTTEPDVFALAAVPDDRAGHALVLAVEPSQAEPLAMLSELWNRSCFPIERLHVLQIARIPRTSLGKVRWGELNQDLRAALELAARI